MRNQWCFGSLLVWFCLICIASPALFVQPGLAGLCVPAPDEPDAYHYIRALINGMSHAKTAVERLLSESSPTATPSEIAYSLLYELRLAKADFECAASQVAPYAENPSELISKSAEGAGVSFLKLAELMDDERLRFKHLLDTPPTKNPFMGTILDQRAEHKASLDDAWRLLIPVATMATYSVIAKDTNTGLWSRLSLTANERDEILKDLKSTFGNEVAKGPQAGQIPLLFAAATLYEVIGNQGRATKEAMETGGQRIEELLREPVRSVKPMFREVPQVAKTTSIDATRTYLSTVEAMIKRQWIAPPVHVSGNSLSAVVKFRLERDGRVSSVKTVESSGNEHYDLSAHRAIRASSPLPAFPPQLTDSYFDVSFTFAAGGP